MSNESVAALVKNAEHKEAEEFEWMVASHQGNGNADGAPPTNPPEAARRHPSPGSALSRRRAPGDQHGGDRASTGNAGRRPRLAEARVRTSQPNRAPISSQTRKHITSAGAETLTAPAQPARTSPSTNQLRKPSAPEKVVRSYHVGDQRSPADHSMSARHEIEMMVVMTMWLPRLACSQANQGPGGAEMAEPATAKGRVTYCVMVERATSASRDRPDRPPIL